MNSSGVLLSGVSRGLRDGETWADVAASIDAYGPLVCRYELDELADLPSLLSHVDSRIALYRSLLVRVPPSHVAEVAESLADAPRVFDSVVCTSTNISTMRRVLPGVQVLLAAGVDDPGREGSRLSVRLTNSGRAPSGLTPGSVVEVSAPNLAAVRKAPAALTRACPWFLDA